MPTKVEKKPVLKKIIRLFSKSQKKAPKRKSLEYSINIQIRGELFIQITKSILNYFIQELCTQIFGRSSLQIIALSAWALKNWLSESFKKVERA